MVVPVATSAVGRSAEVALGFDYTMIFDVGDESIQRVEFQFGHDAVERLVG